MKAQPPLQMVDLHCHFLPDIDDGARDAAETAAMLEIAAQTGTTHLVATPHADTRFQFDPAATARLLDEARVAAPPGLQLFPGCDFHIMHDNLVDALAHPRRYTINASRYLLIELSNQIIFPNTSEMFDRLEQAGLRIIISHPERNPILRGRPELIQQWVEQGRYVQLTAAALTGLWREKIQAFARRLLEAGHVHFIASDGHSPTNRPPRLDEARTWVEQRHGAEFATRLFLENPLAVIEDRPLPQSETLVRHSLAAKPGLWRRLFGPPRTASSKPPLPPKT
jgi:protein-tyrosine phosphatase